MPRPTSSLPAHARYALVTHVAELQAELASVSCPRERRAMGYRDLPKSLDQALRHLDELREPLGILGVEDGKIERLEQAIESIQPTDS